MKATEEMLRVRKEIQEGLEAMSPEEKLEYLADSIYEQIREEKDR